VLRAFSAACLRSRIAFSASPGFDTCERLKAGFASTCGLLGVPPPPRLFLKYPRTFSASSASMELECVFASVTPTAVRASRMDRLLTSSSRARSLIRTLLIRPFCCSPARLAAHISLIEVGIFAISIIIPEIAHSAPQESLVCVT
jgi:hypothetical protein